MMDDIEHVAKLIADQLKRDGYSTRKEIVGGMGSLRILSDGMFVIDINNDRGLLGITIGRCLDTKDEERYSHTYWALCMGIRVAHVEIPVERTLSDREAFDLAQSDAACLLDVMKRLKSLDESSYQKVESCVKRRHERFLEELGLWPLPTDGSLLRMVSPKKPSEQEEALGFREVFSKDYGKER